MISVITPVYNEADRIQESVARLRRRLSADLAEPWELIVVNDGSTDDSLRQAEAGAEGDARVRLVSYRANRGRGYALRRGFAEARGDTLVTTEADLSWGEDIVKRMVEELRAAPEAGLVIASPHLDGGGYENVPRHRILLSRYGNVLLRRIFDGRVTMATGMTRCYRREVIDSMLLNSDDKEIHLEILSKALALGYVPVEIPAVLTWPPGRGARRFARQYGLGLLRLVMTHLLFSVTERPHLFLGTVGLAFLGVGTALGIVDFAWLFLSESPASSKPTVNPTMIALFIFIGLLVLVFDFLAQQNRAIQKDLIHVQREILKLRRPDKPEPKE